MLVTRLEGLSDAELVRRCRTDDPAAWNELVERYSRYVYAIAVRGFRLGDEDAEDVFQDVFTRLHAPRDTSRRLGLPAVDRTADAAGASTSWRAAVVSC